MKAEVSKYFSTNDKLKLYTALKKKTELGLLLALEMFDEILGEMVQSKKKEVEKIFSEMAEQIKSKELKDGKTPQAGVDFPTAFQIQQMVQTLIDKLPKPEITEKDRILFINQIKKSYPKVKDGKTPRAGKDYPTFAQIRAYIESIRPLNIEKKFTKEIRVEADKAIIEGLKRDVQNLQASIRSLSRNRRGKLRGGGDSVVAGSNVTVTRVGGRKVIAATASGGGSNVEEPVGTVNGSNTEFTVSNTPLFIVVDGLTKYEDVHYTYNAGTITIIDGAPPVFYIRSNY